MTSDTTLEVLREPTRAAAVLDPERRRLVEALRRAPDSAAGLARRLGESRQRLNYHLRVLESAGVVELQEERPRRGRMERVLRPVAREFVLDPGALGELATSQDRAGDRFAAAALIGQAARTIRELAAQRDRASEEHKRLATVSLDAAVRLATPSDFRSFVEDLAEAVAEVVSRHHAQVGREFRVVAGAYQRPGSSGRATEEATDGD